MPTPWADSRSRLPATGHLELLEDPVNVILRWGGDCSGHTSATCSLPLDTDHEATATFGLE
jgi:hypothetical protein